MRAFPVIYHVFFQKIQEPLTTFTPGLLDYAMAWLSFEAIKKTTVQGLSESDGYLESLSESAERST